MNEFPSLEMKLIPEDFRVGKGKEERIGRRLTATSSTEKERVVQGDHQSLQGSATDLARQRAEAMNLQTGKGGGSIKGTSKGKDKGMPMITPVRKLPLRL